MQTEPSDAAHRRAGEFAPQPPVPIAARAHQRPVRTKEECLRAAAHVFLMAAIRIEQERLDAGLPPRYRPQEPEE